MQFLSYKNRVVLELMQPYNQAKNAGYVTMKVFMYKFLALDSLMHPSESMNGLVVYLVSA